MVINKLYIIGAGLAGLSAASWAIHRGRKVEIFETSSLAGGRCRSFYDKKLKTIIDNGNHLVFSANKNFYDLCNLINSTNKIKVLQPHLFFFDIENKKTWELSLSILDFLFKKKRVPDAHLKDYLSILKILFMSKESTIKDLKVKNNFRKYFWEPLTLAVMNTSVDKASARVLSNVLKKTIFKGKKYCKIYQPEKNWNETIIEPAINFISKHNKINFNTRLKKVEIKNNLITRLEFNDKQIEIGRDDYVISALPVTAFGKIFNKVDVPNEFNTILNIHYKISDKIKKLFTSDIIGMISSHSQWIFVKNNYLSVTVSDANNFNNESQETLSTKVWEEICLLIGKNIKIPNCQIIKEKKATFVQSPNNFELIKKIKNLPRNLSICGDWTQSDLPCTIEGSIMSGKKSIEFFGV